MSWEILIRRKGALGDVLLTTPVLRALRAKHPDTRIHFETACPGPLEGNPDVHAIHTWGSAPKLPWRVVHDLDLAYERTPLRHVVDSYAEVCGVVTEGRRPLLYPKPRDIEQAALRLPSALWVAVDPGPHHWPGKNWPAERWAEVCDALRLLSKVVLVGHPASPLPCDLDLRGKTSVLALGASLARASVFVGVDSFPMHVAVAMRTPTIGLFGCTDPAFLLPPGEPDCVAVSAPASAVWCLHCHPRLPPPRTQSGCFRERVWCMERLSPEQVLDRVVGMLRTPEPRMAV
jgi:ADP-heptose:LPS heptosyltransferase